MELTKINLQQSDKTYYSAKKEPQLVHLDSYYYLSISGKGDPNGELFMKAIEGIYSIAYGIKFLCKGEDNDFTVPKMECLWWINGGLENQRNFIKAKRNDWNWKILLRMPEVVDSSHYFKAVSNAKQKKPELISILEQVKFELINEGDCVQILHLGSYEEETPNILKMINYIQENGWKITNYHKEIYLTDPRKTATEKLKTILRYQVQTSKP